MKKVIQAIFLCLISQIVFTQTSPVAEKIDEFGKLTCCDMEARIDNFSLALKNRPNSTGYAVISTDTLFQRLYLESTIRDAQSEMHSDQRIKIIRAAGRGYGPEVTFWLVPEGADKPAFEEVPVDFTLSADRKPFLFEFTLDIGVCPIYDLSLGHVSEFLAANPTARVNIVISSLVRSKEHQELKAKLLENASIANVPVERTRFFRGDTRYNSRVEVWIVPGRTYKKQ